MQISQFILHKVHQVTVWCGQKAAQWCGWWVTILTPNWNGLCERVHRLFTSRFTDQSEPLSSPSAPPIPKTTGRISAAGKMLPTKGFKNNDQQTCGYISKAVAILSLAPDLLIPDNEQDAELQAEKAALENLQKQSKQLQIDVKKTLNETRVSKAVVDAKKDLWELLGNSEDVAPQNEIVLQSAKDMIVHIKSLLPKEEIQSRSVQPTDPATRTRKKRIQDLENGIEKLEKAIQEMDTGQENITLLQKDIAENQKKITSSQQQIHERHQSLQDAREAVRIWKEGNIAGKLEKRHAMAITECHPAKDMFAERKPLFKGQKEASEAEKADGHIKVLKTKLENPKESAAILFGGNHHWQVFIRLQDGRFVLFNDNSTTDFWSQEKILNHWSPPAHWLQSQLTFIPEWNSVL